MGGVRDRLTVDVDLLVTHFEALTRQTYTALDIVVTTIYGAIDDLPELCPIRPHSITSIVSA